jgi:cyclohexa-1,5-dienecarbonyl-CoA hydratase
MNDFKHIKLEISNRIARLTLARPPLNILNIEMMKEINSALETVIASWDVNVLGIFAEGKAFSAGVDVGEHMGDTAREMIEVFHGMFRRLVRLKKPTLAVVNGAALGGGCELALFCDLVIASEKAKFGQPEIQVGVFAPIAALVLPYLSGFKKALEVQLLGETFSASEAAAAGLVNKVVPVEQLEQQAQLWLDKLAALSGPVVHYTRKATLLGFEKLFEQLLTEIENIYLNELMKTHDAEEGLKAFLEKRKPNWQHR